MTDPDKTFYQRYLEKRLQDPDFSEAYRTSGEQIALIDAVTNAVTQCLKGLEEEGMIAPPRIEVRYDSDPELNDDLHLTVTMPLPLGWDPYDLPPGFILNDDCELPE